MFNEHDLVVLKRPLPQLGLLPGDVGTVVLVHAHGGLEVEFTTATGRTIGFAALEPAEVSELPEGYAQSIRPLSAVGA